MSLLNWIIFLFSIRLSSFKFLLCMYFYFLSLCASLFMLSKTHCVSTIVLILCIRMLFLPGLGHLVTLCGAFCLSLSRALSVFTHFFLFHRVTMVSLAVLKKIVEVCWFLRRSSLAVFSSFCKFLAFLTHFRWRYISKGLGFSHTPSRLVSPLHWIVDVFRCLYLEHESLYIVPLVKVFYMYWNV